MRKLKINRLFCRYILYFGCLLMGTSEAFANCNTNELDQIKGCDKLLNGGPVNVILPNAAGNSSDTIARKFNHTFTTLTCNKVQFVLENRGGGGGSIGITAAASSKSRTLLMAQSPDFSITPKVQRSPDANMDKFIPIASLADSRYAFVCNKRTFGNTQVDSMNSLAECLKKKCIKTFNVATADATNFTNIAAMKLMEQIHVPFGHSEHSPETYAMSIPFKGTNEAFNDVIAGHAHCMFHSLGSVLKIAKKNPNLQILGVTGSQPLEYLSNGQKKIASTIPGMETFINWTGLYLPKSSALNGSENCLRHLVQKAAENQSLQQYFTNLNLDPSKGIQNAETVQAKLNADMSSYEPLIKQLKPSSKPSSPAAHTLDQ